MAKQEHKIEILKVVKAPSVGGTLPGSAETVVFFLRDEVNADFVIIPRDTTDLTVIVDAIRKELASRDKIAGEKFTA